MEVFTAPTHPINAQCTHEKIKELHALLLHNIKAPKMEPKLLVKGHRNNSDIKWNAMTGEMFFDIPKEAQAKGFQSLFKAHIQPVTGNCGVKAISHLWLYKDFTKTKDEHLKEKATLALNIIEDFLYHNTNCGLVLASDTIGGGTHQIIQAGEKGWNETEHVWNPNYTWSKDHKVSMMWKVLNKEELPNYFGNVA